MHGQEYEVLVVDTAGQDEYSIFPTQVLLISRLFFVRRPSFFVRRPPFSNIRNPVQRRHRWVRDGLFD